MGQNSLVHCDNEGLGITVMPYKSLYLQAIQNEEYGACKGRQIDFEQIKIQGAKIDYLYCQVAVEYNNKWITLVNNMDDHSYRLHQSTERMVIVQSMLPTDWVAKTISYDTSLAIMQ